MNRFSRKPSPRDYLIPGSDASPVETACHMATALLDRAIRDMDRKWGIDRLPELVSPDTAAKWGDYLGRLNAAIAAVNLEAVKDITAKMLFGIGAMDREAEAANAPKADTRVFEASVDGFAFAVLFDEAAWPAVQAARPELNIVTARQVAEALKRNAEQVVAVAEAVKAGGKVTGIRSKPPVDWGAGGDMIPF